MRPLRLVLLGLCACATGSPSAQKPVEGKEPAHPTLADLNVTCGPVGSDPLGFSFVAGPGGPSCNDCLAMVDSIQFLCQRYPQYCRCLQQAFVMNCTKYSEQIRQGCKQDEQPLPVSDPLVQG
jgi:hypothetical protein